MRAQSQNLYWALVAKEDSDFSASFTELGSLARLPIRSSQTSNVLNCLEELKNSGLVSYLLDLGGVSNVAIDSSDDAQRTMKSVFVIHGHDDSLLAEVDAFLLRVGLYPIILRSMPSSGKTIIEKIESYSNVQFAVCLLTPDDEGCSRRSNAASRPRARQNVVLELGYFIGRLGRERVHVLHRGDIELPSDYHGVVYTATDVPNIDWRVALCKEMRASGLPVDIAAIM